jgi:hypothetical protein
MILSTRLLLMVGSLLARRILFDDPRLLQQFGDQT